MPLFRIISTIMIIITIIITIIMIIIIIIIIIVIKIINSNQGIKTYIHRKLSKTKDLYFYITTK